MEIEKRSAFLLERMKAYYKITNKAAMKAALFKWFFNQF